MPSNSLREANIEKGNEFRRLILRSLLLSWAIFIIAIVIAAMAPNHPYRLNGAERLLPLIVMVIIPLFLFFRRLGIVGTECPECKAFGNIIKSNSEMIGETYMGRKYEESSDMYTVGGEKPKGSLYAVFSRTYDYHYNCNCCEHQWTERVTRTEKERI